MIYEDFSPEAKEAIDFWRQKLPMLLTKYNVRVNNSFGHRMLCFYYPGSSIYSSVVWNRLSDSLFLFGVTDYDNKSNILDFAQSKDFWIPKENIK